MPLINSVTYYTARPMFSTALYILIIDVIDLKDFCCYCIWTYILRIKISIIRTEHHSWRVPHWRRKLEVDICLPLSHKQLPWQGNQENYPQLHLIQKPQEGFPGTQPLPLRFSGRWMQITEHDWVCCVEHHPGHIDSVWLDFLYYPEVTQGDDKIYYWTQCHPERLSKSDLRGTGAEYQSLSLKVMF